MATATHVQVFKGYEFCGIHCFCKMLALECLNYENVTGFGKTCIVHTSDFAHLDIHKNHSE